MKKIWMWFLLLNKRLYKKVTYVGILLLIPVLVLIFSLSTKQPGGVLTIVLAREDPTDPLASALVEELKSDTMVITFLEAQPQAAKDMVAAGKADAAWIFPAQLQQRMREYAAGNAEGFIQVVEREQSVPLMLSREKLGGVLHGQVVKEVYLRYIREIAPQTQQVADAELLTFLDNTDVSGEMFAFYDITGNKRSEAVNYLTTPIRGLLAVLAVVCSVVTAMYYQSDYDHGIFSLLPEKGRILGEFGYQMISAIHILIVSMVALLISGLSAVLWKELLILLLYSVSCALFGMLLRAVFGGKRGLAVLIPVLCVVMLCVCPVFFDIAQLRSLQYLMPPTYYINCAFNQKYFLYLFLYNVILLAVLAAVITGKKTLKRLLICRRNVV